MFVLYKDDTSLIDGDETEACTIPHNEQVLRAHLAHSIRLFDNMLNRDKSSIFKIRFGR